MVPPLLMFQNDLQYSNIYGDNPIYSRI